MPEHSTISRRTLLRGAAFTAAGAATMSASNAEAGSPVPDLVGRHGELPAAEDRFDLQTWLDTAEFGEVMHYHSTRLAEAMQKADPERRFFAKVDRRTGYALVFGEPAR